eukprot:9007792-Karenia_brevis.AAC.1
MDRVHNNFLWAIMYGAQVISRPCEHDDRATGWQKAFGRSKLPRTYAAWGEKILWLLGGKKKVQASGKWYEGIFLGLKDRTEEAVIGIPD